MGTLKSIQHLISTWVCTAFHNFLWMFKKLEMPHGNGNITVRWCRPVLKLNKSPVDFGYLRTFIAIRLIRKNIDEKEGYKVKNNGINKYFKCPWKCPKCPWKCPWKYPNVPESYRRCPWFHWSGVGSYVFEIDIWCRQQVRWVIGRKDETPLLTHWNHQ